MALFDLSSLLGVAPVDPKALMEQASSNVQNATNAATEAANKLESTRKSLETAQKAAAQATAQAYATEVQNRKSDLTITAEAAASLKEVTPSGVTSIAEFATVSPELNNFKENLYGMVESKANKEVNVFTDLATAAANSASGGSGEVSLDALMKSQENILNDMQNSVGNSATKLATDMIKSKVSAAVGDGKACTSSIQSLATTAVKDPNKLVNDPNLVIGTAAKCGSTYLKYSSPAAALTSSFSLESIATSVATKALGNTTALQANPKILDTCVQTISKSTGSCMDVYQKKIENVLGSAINDPCSFDYSAGFSRALNQATSTCVSNAMTGTGSKASSLVTDSVKSLASKVTSGVVSTEAAQKATSMMSSAFSMPGLDRIGTVGQKIGKKMMTTYESNMTSTVRRYMNSSQYNTTSMLQNTLGKLF